MSSCGPPRGWWEFQWARAGIDLDVLEEAIRRERPRLLVVTPNFQNPTGVSLPLPARQAVLRLARAAAVVVVENDIYGGLRYKGEDLPTLRQLDPSGDTILLRSFSKIAFPGLRVGWVLGPGPLLARLADAKQTADLHSCQLAQAVVLRFAESGRLEAHRQRVVAACAKRLSAVLGACEDLLPKGSRFTRPEGGMNLWVRLPEPLDAADLLPKAQQEGVTYIPGRYFEVSRRDPGGLRLSFAGLPPADIRSGIEILGRVAQAELERLRDANRWNPAPAMV